MKKLVFAACAAFGAVALSPAHAVVVGFERITNNSPADAAGQLSAEILDVGDGITISFTVSAGPNPDANVTEIYFSDLSTLFAPPPSIVTQSAGVSFTDDGSVTPGELPGANNASPPFVTTASLASEATGSSATGLTIGETLILKLTYAGMASFGDVLAALDNGQFRIGMHVRSLLQGASDGFVNTPPAEVPVPGAIWLMGAGLAGLGFAGRKKKAA